MALTSIELTVTNNEYKGYVEIASTLKPNPDSRISYILLSRRKSGIENDYIRIYEKQIDSTDDLVFYCLDITARSGTSYDYYIELTNDNETGYIVYEFESISGVESWFDGLFIGNDTAQYLAPLDCETSTVQNTQVNYVNTLFGKTPYRISNSNANYRTGQSTALFMPLDEYMDPLVQDTKEYTNEVVSFLSNGENKILKTSDGDIWYVSVNQNIRVNYNEHYNGYYKISFDWTEIDEVPYEISDEATGKKLVSKAITANGTYYPSTDNADGYSYVTVNVPSTTVSVQGHTLIYQSA